MMSSPKLFNFSLSILMFLLISTSAFAENTLIRFSPNMKVFGKEIISSRLLQPSNQTVHTLQEVDVTNLAFQSGYEFRFQGGDVDYVAREFANLICDLGRINEITLSSVQFVDGNYRYSSPEKLKFIPNEKLFYCRN